jgi:hypothetical protein
MNFGSKALMDIAQVSSENPWVRVASSAQAWAEDPSEARGALGSDARERKQ